MNKRLKELRAKKEALMNTMRSILSRCDNEKRGLTSEEVKDFDGIKAKVEVLDETLKRAGVLGEMRADLERVVVAGPVIPENGNNMIHVSRNIRPGDVRCYKPNEAMSEQRYEGPGVGAYVRGIVTGKWDGAEDLRSLAEGSTPGSYLVPTPLAMNVIDVMRAT